MDTLQPAAEGTSTTLNLASPTLPPEPSPTLTSGSQGGTRFPQSPSIEKLVQQDQQSRPTSRTERRTSMQSVGSSAGAGVNGIPHSHAVEDVSTLKRQVQELKQQLAQARATIATADKASKAATSRRSPHINSATSPPLGLNHIPHSSPMFDLRKQAASPPLAPQGGLRSPVALNFVDERAEERAHGRGQDAGHLDGLGFVDADSAIGDTGESSLGSAMDSMATLGLNRIPPQRVAASLSLHSAPHSASSDPTQTPSAVPGPSSYRGIRRSTSTHSLRSNGSVERSPSPFLPRSAQISTGGGGRKASAGGSSRVIEGLQGEVEGLKGMLDRVRGELRTSQRTVGTLTRQNEDLKETKTRMRTEADTLNNVINRKERLLQEVLERARTAESSAAALTKARHALETSSRKSLAEATARVDEAEHTRTKAEREALALKDGVKSMKDGWRREVGMLRGEIKAAEERGRAERAEMRTKQAALNKLLQAHASDKAHLSAVEAELARLSSSISALFGPQIASLTESLEAHARGTTEDAAQTRLMQDELGRLRRLMRTGSAGLPDLGDQETANKAA